MSLNIGEISGLGRFQHGTARVKDRDTELYFHVDIQGKPLYSERFSYVGEFCETSAPAKDPRSELWGLIDRKGQYLAPPEYKSIYYTFGDGLVGAYTTNDSALYLDSSGKTAFTALKPGELGTCYPFINGMARKHTEERFGMIDKSGDWVWSMKKTKDGPGSCYSFERP